MKYCFPCLYLPTGIIGKKREGDRYDFNERTVRYAIRVMLDLAEHDNGGYIPLKDITVPAGDIQKVSGDHRERSGRGAC